MPSAFTWQGVDYDGDKRQFTVPALAMTAANFDAQVALAQALRAAINDVTLCANTDYAILSHDVDTGDVQPTDPYAQAQIEWRVTYHYDSDPEIKRTFRIPGADLGLTDVLLPSSNVADLAQTEIAALVTALEDYVRTDDGVSAITVEQIEFLE